MTRSRNVTRARGAGITLLVQLLAATLGASAWAQGAAPVVQARLNQSAFTPGQTLRFGVDVANPGGGPTADFYVGIQLPDGVSTVSVRLGAGPAVGSLANLAALQPTAVGVPLAAPFAVSQPGLLTHTFTGNEPVGTYVGYIAAVESGALRDGALGPGELLGFHTATFTFGAGGILLTGPPEAPALQATTGYHGSAGVPDAAISIDGAGLRVARTQIEVKFHATATVGQVNAALTAVNGRIVSMLPGVLILLVQIPDPGSLAALEQVMTTLRQAPGVAAVIRQGFPDLAALPPNYAPGSPDLPKIDHLLAARTHAAWNTEAALRRPGVVRPLLVMADGFGLTAPGAAFDIAMVPDDFADTRYERHGYHVLGTIAATFGGDATETGLATGLIPGTTSVRAVDIRDNNPTAGDYQNRLLTHVRDHPGNVVVNTSLQFDCMTAAAVAANCIPATAQRAGAEWLEKVRGTAGLRVQGAGLEGRFLHAAAAGNVSVIGDTDAATATHYAAAALVPGMTDGSGAAVPNAVNTLVVENRIVTPEPFRPGCLSVISKRVLARTASTNLVNVSAIGTDVFNLTAPITAAGDLTGTSMATPQVAALALWVWALRPNLTNRQVMQLITDHALANLPSTDDLRCSTVAPAPAIDVFATVLATDTALNDAPVRLALLDVVDASGHVPGDGRFDDHDIAHFVQGFSAAGGVLDYSRLDLNGDGETGGASSYFFDLNLNRSYETVTTTGGISRTVDENLVTDLDVLCHYAYSTLFTGAASARDTLIGQACGLVAVEVVSTSLASAVQAGAGGTSNSATYSDATPNIPPERFAMAGYSPYSGSVYGFRRLTPGALGATSLVVVADAGHWEPSGTTLWQSQASATVVLVVRSPRNFTLRQLRYIEGNGVSATSTTRLTGTTDAGQAVSIWDSTASVGTAFPNFELVASGRLEPGTYTIEIRSESAWMRNVDSALELNLAPVP